MGSLIRVLIPSFLLVIVCFGSMYIPPDQVQDLLFSRAY